MATIDEIRMGMARRAIERRIALRLIVNPNPDRVIGRRAIPDWYVNAIKEQFAAHVLEG